MKTNPVKKILTELFWHYSYLRLRRPKHEGWLESDENRILEGLRNLGIPVQDFFINVDQYKDYVARAAYSSRYPNYYSHNIAEKSLEHFVAQELLQLNSSDVYIDIASEGSPTPQIYQRLYGCTTYAQDLSYEPGIHANRIGSNAASLPLPAGAVTKMALHCSFEHFEGNSDTEFIKEAARVLRIGGKIVIVPLYLCSRYVIATDFLASRFKRIRFEPDATIMAVKGLRNRYCKQYDPYHLSFRVLKATNDLSFSIFHVINSNEIDKSIYAKFILVASRI